MSPLPAALCAVGRSTSRGGTHAPHTRRVRTDEAGWRTQASSAQPDASIRTAAPPTCRWRSRSVLPLHVHPIVPIVTIPECQALGAPRPHERRSGTTRLEQVFLASAEVEVRRRASEKSAPRGEHRPPADASIRRRSARGRTHASAPPPRTQASKAGPLAAQIPGWLARPPLEAVVFPRRCRGHRPPTGTPLPLMKAAQLFSKG